MKLRERLLLLYINHGRLFVGVALFVAYLATLVLLRYL